MLHHPNPSSESVVRQLEARRRWRLGLLWQVGKFTMVGVLSNGVPYFLYLALTWRAVPVLVAMSFAFALGVFISWTLNGWLTFRARLSRSSGMRMVLVYLGAYAANLLLLSVAVHIFSLPHQWAQAFIIVLLALVLFVVQKRWVFSTG